MPDGSVRRALYVLFARLLAGPPDAALYDRLRSNGLGRLAAVQGVDLTSDLMDETDAEAAALELRAEYDDLARTVSLRASDYESGSEDPVAALSAFLREHRLRMDADLPCDHLAVAFGIMGELAGQADDRGDAESLLRARTFFLRHIQPWAQRALADLAGAAQRRFWRGLAAMVSAFLESERRAYESA